MTLAILLSIIYQILQFLHCLDSNIRARGEQILHHPFSAHRRGHILLQLAGTFSPLYDFTVLHYAMLNCMNLIAKN
jgi:hypothetical protein